MAVDPEAPIRVSPLSWVPDFAQGHVRDLRVRWALEEAGRDDATELVLAAFPRLTAFRAQTRPAFGRALEAQLAAFQNSAA